MKSLLLILFLSSLAFGQSIAERVKKFENGKRYEVSYDKFQKQTKIKVPVFVSTKSKFLELRPILRIHDDGRSDVTLLASGGTSSFHTRPTMRLLLDGQLLELESDDIDAIVGFVVSGDDFAKIANAKLVEIQLGNFEGKLDAKSHTIFKNLYSLLKVS